MAEDQQAWEAFVAGRHAKRKLRSPGYPHPETTDFINETRGMVERYCKKKKISQTSYKRQIYRLNLNYKYFFTRTFKQDPQYIVAGWEWKDRANTRPIRDHSNGMLGNDIYFYLKSKGFFNASIKQYAGLDDSFEEKLKHWLAWGYFE